MVPAFEAGDRLIVVPVAELAPGHVVAVRDPREPGRVLVKRVLAVTADHLEVRGDDPAASTDSRHFGPVPKRLLVGRVV
jgi:nickel-type superoxide dismutase maturation protease